MHRFLDIRAIEIDRRPRIRILQVRRKTQRIAQQRTLQAYLIHVEAGVGRIRSVIDRAPDVAISIASMIEIQRWLCLVGRKFIELVTVRRIPARFVKILELRNEALVKTKNIVVLLDKREEWDLILYSHVLPNAWIVRKDTCGCGLAISSSPDTSKFYHLKD